MADEGPLASPEKQKLHDERKWETCLRNDRDEMKEATAMTSPDDVPTTSKKTSNVDGAENDPGVRKAEIEDDYEVRSWSRSTTPDHDDLVIRAKLSKIRLRKELVL